MHLEVLRTAFRNHAGEVDGYFAALAHESARLTEPFAERLAILGPQILDSRNIPPGSPDPRPEFNAIYVAIRKGEMDFAQKLARPDVRPFDSPARIVKDIDEILLNNDITEAYWNRDPRTREEWKSSRSKVATDAVRSDYQKVRRRAMYFVKFVPDILQQLPVIEDPVQGLISIHAWCTSVISSWQSVATPGTRSLPQNRLRAHPDGDRSYLRLDDTKYPVSHEIALWIEALVEANGHPVSFAILKDKYPNIFVSSVVTRLGGKLPDIIAPFVERKGKGKPARLRVEALQ